MQRKPSASVQHTVYMASGRLRQKLLVYLDVHKIMALSIYVYIGFPIG